MPSLRYSATALGPFLEFLQLVSTGGLPEGAIGCLVDPGRQEFVDIWKAGQQIWHGQDRHAGLLRVQEDALTHERVTAFLMEAKRCATEFSHLPGNVPGQMVAAMYEMKGNIEEHSGSPTTGFIAFQASSDMFEFVVADRGIGLLESLRQNPTFAGMNDHSTALRAALSDGVSRFQDPLRGYGFRPIFQGLTDLRGYLRFRTGDHALVMDGTGPSLATAQVSQKTFLPGFFASVSCRR
jgi:hypothetical protein